MELSELLNEMNIEWNDADLFPFPNAEIREAETAYRDAILSAIPAEIVRDIKRIIYERHEYKEQMNRYHKLIQSQKAQIVNIEDAKKEAANQRIKELVKPFLLDVYQPQSTSARYKKCEYCNDRGYLKMVGANGQTIELYCQCREYANIYKPTSVGILELDENDHGYRHLTYRGYGNSSSTILLENGEIPYVDDVPFEEIEKSAFFQSKAKCQEFCDWLNEKLYANAKAKGLKILVEVAK